ncbi:MAG: peptide chain release factor-like protein, partial [Candidatus Hodgkinia cicadicola]
NADGCLKDALIELEGLNVDRVLTLESGVHRVQRIPTSDPRGRIHTSTVTIAILPKLVKHVITDIPPSTLRVETKRSTGAGGQHVNTTDSAVRITHKPSGIVVNSSHKSQHQNKTLALQSLRQKLERFTTSKLIASRACERTKQIGSANRNEKTRTYNFVRDEVVDHKSNTVIRGVMKVMKGLVLSLEQ